MAAHLQPQLLEILACPCPEHAPLREGFPDNSDAEYVTGTEYLTCTACGRSFPIRDGIPVLLLEEAVGGAEPDGGSGKG